MSQSLSITDYRTQLQKRTETFLQNEADLQLWVQELLLTLLDKTNGLSELALPLRLSDTEVRRFVRRLAGEPPYPPRTQKKLERLDGLAALWLTAGLAYVPTLTPWHRLTRTHCVRFAAGNEEAAHTFRLLTEQFLYSQPFWPDPSGLTPERDAFGLDEEDHRSCSAMFALLMCGDVLSRDLAVALADFSVNGLSTQEPWTMVARYGHQKRRWPLSWVSVLYLMRLLAWRRGQEPLAFMLFGPRYFTWAALEKVEEDRKKGRKSPLREPVKDARGRVILHRTFNKWLSWLFAWTCRSHPEAQRYRPVKLTLNSAITAARILAATRCPPAVVTYLSGRMPSPPMDQPSWDALIHGKPAKINQVEESKEAAIAAAPSGGLDAAGASLGAQKQAEEALRSLRLLLMSLDQKHALASRQMVEGRILALAQTLPFLEAQDGDKAYLGHLKGALLYMAHRLHASTAQPRSLLGEIAKVSDVALNLLGTRSLFLLTEEELTGLAVDYVQGYETYNSRRTAKAFLKRFLDFLLGHRQGHAAGEESSSPVNWRHPDLKLEHNLDARGIVTPSQFDEFLAGVQDGRDQLGFTILGCLGMYCGLRESEAVNLTAYDIQVATELEVVIRQSKTPSGRRRLPVSVLVPPPWRETVVSYLRSLWQIRGSSPQTPILPEPEKAMQRMERALKRGLGASSHVLRHSAVSLLVIRLYLAYNLMSGKPACPRTEELRGRLELLHGQLFSSTALLDLAQGLLGPGWRTSQPMIIPVASKLLGHAEPGVTVSVYLHALDFLAAATRALSPQQNLSLDQAAAMREVSARTILRMRKTGRTGYPVRLIALDWARKLKVARSQA